MSRRRRLHVPGGLYHVTSRGNRRLEIFRSSSDYRKFQWVLARMVRDHPVKLLAYCLMPNHFHLLIKISDEPLSIFMHHLASTYSHWWNAKHRLTGHLFGMRYHDVLCQEDRYLMALLRYIHLNPVRGNLVKDAKAWPWSSLPAYLTGPIKWIAAEEGLRLLHEDSGMARTIFNDLIQTKVPNGESELIGPRTRILGSEEFLQQVQGLPLENETKKVPAVTPDELIQVIYKIHGVTIDEIRGAGQAKEVVLIRQALAQVTKQWWRWSHVKMSALINKSPVAVLKMRQKYLKRDRGPVDRMISQWEQAFSPVNS